MSWQLGKRTKLAALDSEEYSKLNGRWMADAEYNRLLDSDPAIPLSVGQLRHLNESHTGNDDRIEFLVKTVADEKPIGFTALFLGDSLRIHGDAFLAIGIGEPEYRGKGYGSEALNLTLAFAFTELMLHRVSLGVFTYNARAIRAYEKAGFVHEGTRREDMRRDGQWHGSHIMGILRREWLALHT
jgi:RimJ/RimL family protein N-acetyltransferase